MRTELDYLMASFPEESRKIKRGSMARELCRKELHLMVPDNIVLRKANGRIARMCKACFQVARKKESAARRLRHF